MGMPWLFIIQHQWALPIINSLNGGGSPESLSNLPKAIQLINGKIKAEPDLPGPRDEVQNHSTALPCNYDPRKHQCVKLYLCFSTCRS